MKKFLVALLFALSFGCASLGLEQQPLPVDEQLSEPVQLAQTVINEARLTAIAAVNVTVQYVEEGWMTKEEGREYYYKLKDLNDRLSDAQALLDLGKTSEAQLKADLLQKAIVALHNEILKRKSA